jgi:hypothetical protein
MGEKHKGFFQFSSIVIHNKTWLTQSHKLAFYVSYQLFHVIAEIRYEDYTKICLDISALIHNMAYFANHQQTPPCI